MDRIYLVGFMGSGKTTTGKRLSEKLNFQWIDTDKFIERRRNKTVSQIISENGQDKYRQIENSVIEELSTYEGVVVSCGGGLPCFYDNMLIMNKTGITIYLKTSITVLVERLKTAKAERFFLKNKPEDELEEYISKTLQGREFFYNQAKIIIDTQENFGITENIVENLRIRKLINNKAVL
ncbi:MAG: shikimate kinase [Prevotellaceae bacterium]|nr:shikimate kinase [Prevotellaceae bacterium]